MSNPLLATSELPPFDAIAVADIEPAVDAVLEKNRQQLKDLLQQGAPFSWKTLLAPLENMGDELEKLWAPVSHLNAVANTDEIRDVYNRCRQKLSDYATEMGQHADLFAAYKSVQEADDFAQLDTAQQKVLANGLRDFHLSGIDLPDDQKARYAEIQQQLTRLTSQFANNVLDATQSWNKRIVDATELQGLPDTALAAARQTAEAKSQEGYLLTLDFPCYLAVMTYCENRELRREMYDAFVTRASERGPGEGQWDNGPLMVEIIQLRQQLADVLGFGSYADYSLATKMAGDPQQVLTFLKDLAQKSRVVAKKEFAELEQFAREHCQLDSLEGWDLPFVGERLRLHRYAISQEELRAYFPLPKVLSGLFEITSRLYGVEFRKESGIALWHDDAEYFSVLRDGEVIAGFYLDLFAREGKRGGSWMADCRCRRILDDGAAQLPVAFLTCNFMAPVGDNPSLLTHNEVTTLFHEFGHGLHHMMTTVDYLSVSGINGVAWDAVELPSQFMENWCWEKDAIPLISEHFETAEPLPDALLEKMLAAKNFQSGMQMLRQIEFALFDFSLHMKTSGVDSVADIQALLNAVRDEVAVVKPPTYNRFQHSFSHIFAGGYAAGYYSYKWAEVLSADAFSLFEEQGIFNRDAGNAFLQSILERGGSREPAELFKDFRGREPSIDALLRHSGIC